MSLCWFGAGLALRGEILDGLTLQTLKSLEAHTVPGDFDRFGSFLRPFCSIHVQLTLTSSQLPSFTGIVRSLSTTTMENPSICLTGPDRVTTSVQADASKERRRRLPLLSTESAHAQAVNQPDYGQFSLSPMRSPFTARNFMRSALTNFTPITAVAVKGPAIAAPGTPLRTTLLERYLSEHRPLETLSEDSPGASPLTLSKAGISDALRASNGLPWGLITASPPETNSDCFSPVLGTGPAEQFQGLSPLSFEPPNSVFDEGDDDDDVVLITLPWETAATLWPRRNSFPSYGEEIQKSGNFFKTMTEPRSPSGPKSPISERGYASHPQPPTEAFKSTHTNSTTPPPATTFGASPNELAEGQKRAGLSPSFPAPINTSIPREWRHTPSPHSSRYSPLPPEPFLDAVLRSPPPAPAPTKLLFSEQLPASPLRSKPAPIDTSSSLSNGGEYDPLSTARTARWPPVPDRSKLQFSEQLPASPARSEPAPIDTSPRLDQTFDAGDPNTAISLKNPPPAPDASKLRFNKELPASPAKSRPAPIDTSPRLDQTFDRGDPNTAISLENPPPAPLPSKLQFSEQLPASPARSKPAPIDTSPRLDQSFESGDPNTAIYLENPPPAPPPSKVQFSETLPPNPMRSKPAPIDTSPLPDISNSYVELLGSARTPHHPSPASMASRFGNRPKRTVRFAEDVQSPTVRSAVPVTPHPSHERSPRALGGTVDVALVTPTSAELIPKSAVERKGDPWENMPAEGANEAARGRQSRRLQQAGRLTRSASPVSPGAGKDEVVAVKVLPNTVYDAERGALVQTGEKVLPATAHYFLVPAVYQQEKR